MNTEKASRNILVPASMVGLMMLPLILFHQIQLMVCATLARRYAERARTDYRSLAVLGALHSGD